MNLIVIGLVSVLALSLCCVSGVALLYFASVWDTRRGGDGDFSGGDPSGSVVTSEGGGTEFGAGGGMSGGPDAVSLLQQATLAYIGDVDREILAGDQGIAQALQSHRPDLAASAARRAASAIRRIPSAGVDPSVVQLAHEWAQFFDMQASLCDRVGIALQSTLEDSFASGALMGAGAAQDDPGAFTLGLLGWLGTVAQAEDVSKRLQTEAQQLQAWGQDLAARWIVATAPYRQ